jgi:bisanhydrobacterioruberin hydratase
MNYESPIFNRSLLIASISAYMVMWIGGVCSYMFLGGPPEDASWTAPLFLLLAGIIVVVSSRPSDLFALVAVSLLGFAAEAVGVRYRFLFGHYSYTDTLMPLLMGVPIVMASAWLVLVAYIREMLLPFNLPGWMEVTVASLWMTAIDLVIDPLAAGRLGYWQWEETGAYYGVPARNFLGWFTVSLLIFGLLRLLAHSRQGSSWPRHVGLSIILFFTLIALSYSLFLAGAIGVALCMIHIALRKHRHKKIRNS